MQNRLIPVYKIHYIANVLAAFTVLCLRLFPSKKFSFFSSAYAINATPQEPAFLR